MNPESLLSLAEFAKKAYDEPRTILFSTGICYDFGGGILRIGYSGTNSIDDIPVDIGFWPSKRGEHSAIAARADELLLPTLNIIDTYVNQRRNVGIQLVAHSLGGGLAQIIAKRLTGFDVEAITFGSPRVFMIGAKGSPKHTRVAHRDDLVTKVPVWPFVHKETSEVLIGRDEFGIDLKDHSINTYIDIFRKRTQR